MKLVLFQRRLGWYWRLVAGNGRTDRDGAPPFASKRNARRGAAAALCEAAARYHDEGMPLDVQPLKRKARR